MADNTAFSLLKQRSIGSSRQVFEGEHGAPQRFTNPPPPGSLYIHIPFCSHKCHYCDFYSIVDRQDRQARFTDRLVRELAAQARFAQSRPLETIFVGGGTPSLLQPSLWVILLKAIDEHFDLSRIRAGRGEFTVECNPESVTPELASVLAGGGVSRASLGAQSFNAAHLKSLERLHDPAKVPTAVAMLRDAGIARTSIDLIYAIPAQTLGEWDHDLRTALSLPIEHISAYALTYEPGTAMTARLHRGEFEPAPDETEAEMYQHAITTLRAAGFERYEVSNHARPGAACAHNLAYWRQHDWLGVGPSASGHYRGQRWKNTPRLDDYLNEDDEGFAPLCDFEPADKRRELMDLLMTSIRLAEGADAAAAVSEAHALDRGDDLLQAATAAADRGWIADAGAKRWTLTEEGFLFADRVAREFIGALMVDDASSSD